MARRRSDTTLDLRAYYLEGLLRWRAEKERSGVCPPGNEARIAKVSAGEPFLVRGWEVRLQPLYDDFLIEADGRAVRLERTSVWTGDVECVDLRRPDGTLVASWPQPPRATRQQVAG